MSVKVRFFRGLWRVMVDYHRKRISAGFKSEARAREVAEKLKVALDLYGIDALAMISKAKSPEEKRVPLFRTFAAAWGEALESRDIRDSTRSSYRYHLASHLMPEFGDLELGEIDYRAIKKLRADLSERYSRDTVRLALATLSLVMDEAVREEWIPANPAAQLPRMQRTKDDSQVEVFTREELHRIEAVIQTHFPEYYEFVLFLARTGVRIGEAIGLKWEDLDLVGGTARIRRNVTPRREIEQTKTRTSKRTVDLSPELTIALKGLKARRASQALQQGSGRSEWVFCGSTGEPIQYGNFRRRVWVRALEKAKVPYRAPHDLRHTWASLTLSVGADLAYVSRQLGHASPDITLRIYTHWVPGSRRIPMDHLDKGRAENAQKSKTEVGG